MFIPTAVMIYCSIHVYECQCFGAMFMVDVNACHLAVCLLYSSPSHTLHYSSSDYYILYTYTKLTWYL